MSIYGLLGLIAGMLAVLSAIQDLSYLFLGIGRLARRVAGRRPSPAAGGFDADGGRCGR